MDTLGELNQPIQDLKKYAIFIPFYVWLDNVCKIVKHSITAREVGFELAKMTD